VLLGELVSRHVPAIWVKRAAGLVFVVLGLIYLIGAKEEPGARSGEPPAAGDQS